MTPSEALPAVLDRAHLLSIVVPCYNEQGSLRELHRRASATAAQRFGDAYEIIFVDDGSTDQTWTIIAQLSTQDSAVVGLRLARNLGHQLALTAGLSAARGEIVLVMDADLQDPPELLGAMHDLMLRESADVVYGHRRSRAGETNFKINSAAIFYRLLSGITNIDIPQNTGDFRLMTRRIVDHLNSMPEHDRFIRGMVTWLGYKQVAFDYDRNPRFAGETKYPLRKMISFAADALIGFSIIPLRLATFLGAFLILLLFAIGIYAFYQWLFVGTAPGWTSLTLLVVSVAAVQLFVLGVMGEYVGRIYVQSKQRPLFMISEIVRGTRDFKPDITPQKN